VEHHDGFLRPETHICPTHALQPFQGFLDRDGSGTSGHPVHGKDYGRGGCRGRVCDEQQAKHSGKNQVPSTHHIPPMLWPVWDWSALMTRASTSEVNSGKRSSTIVVVTTRLARISSASVVRLPAIRHASASQRRRSRRYKTKPVMMPMIPAGTRSQRYRIVVAMNAPLPSPSRITVRGRRQQSDASAAPTHATTPAPSVVTLITSSYIASAANAPYSNVSRYARPQHRRVSPGFTSSGSVMTSSHSGQLTQWARVADH